MWVSVFLITVQMGGNSSYYLWGAKRVIGSNSCIQDLEKEKQENMLHQSLSLDNNRAVYSVNFVGKPLKFDSELLTGYTLQYICYLCQKGPNDMYDMMTVLSQEFKRHNKLCITVGGWSVRSL